MTGAGERVRALGPGAPQALVLLPSPHGLSTPAVYREFDRLGVQRSAEELAELESRGGGLPVHNDLQEAARSLCPPVGDALAAVAATGADEVLVSGSGPTVFGVFDDPERARSAAAAVGGIAAEPVEADFGAVREA
jgi:4-diphosphocytidyl-2-C-methyl-D-erythritol kinase